jgi:class 3 adenylate cyclase
VAYEGRGKRVPRWYNHPSAIHAFRRPEENSGPDPTQMASDSRSWLASLNSRAFSEHDTEQEKLNKTLLIFTCGLMGFAAMVWLAIYQAMGIRFSTTVPFTYMVISAASLGLYLWKGNFPLFRFIQTSLFLFVPFIMQWSIGSYVSSSGVMLWALLAPVGVMIFQGARESMPWFFAYIVMTAVSGFFDYYLGEGVESGVTMQSIAVFFALNFAAMSTIVYLLIRYFVSQRDKLAERITEQNLQLKDEQEKSERLLLNILPGPIAQRLKQQSSIIADGFADVTVMFADIINFTRLSEEMSPRLMVGLLNEVFSHFDQLAEKHGIEKIKTIGDAYMVAGGLDVHHRSQGTAAEGDDRDYSAAVCNMALEMCEYMDSRSGFKRARLQIHVGIGTGPVVAGVIGMKKFIYDLWGDTVNIASRVTAEAGASTILVDVTTYRRVRHLFEFEGPRTLVVKGKGELPAYRLIGRSLQQGAAQRARA